jgi:hypothetical protein
MMRVFLSMTLAGVAIVGTAQAQVGAPLLGYLPDGGTLRAMNGIAAAGSIGPALGTLQSLDQVAVSPGGTFALASASDGSVNVVTVAGGGLNFAPIAGVAAGTLTLSPNGSAGLVSAGGALQVITGLPGSPSAHAPMNVAYLGAAGSLAVSDDGQWIAGVFGGAVNAIDVNGQPTLLPAPSGVTALAFYHGASDLVATTGTQIVKITSLGGSPAVSTLFGSADAPPASEAPIAIALTADNSQLVLLEPDGGIGEINLATGAITTANCGCQPQGLIGLSGSIFRLSNLAEGSVKVYDADSGNVLFVPLAPAGTEGGQQ